MRNSIYFNHNTKYESGYKSMFCPRCAGNRKQHRIFSNNKGGKTIECMKCGYQRYA